MAPRRRPARSAPAASGPTPAGASDTELVRDVLAGDARALERLIERLHCVPRLLMAQNMQLGTPLPESELEDVVRDTLLALWRDLPRYDGKAALETWAQRFGFFELLGHLRARRRGPDLAWAEHERIEAGLAALGPTEAELVRLRHLEGLPLEQLADRLSLPANAARTRYYGGMRRLRAAFAGEPGADEGPQGTA